ASLFVKIASVYDPYWSVVPPFLLLLAVINAGAVHATMTMLYLAILIWAVRLTGNWASLWTDFSEQDWRYDMFREKAPRLWPLVSFFGIMFFPTLIVFVQLAVPLRMAGVTEGGAWAYLGASIILLGVFLQWLSDRQMASFRHRNHGRKACIEEGLWRYSRHPNYFGEIIVWWGVYVASIGFAGPIGLHLLAPLAMTCMFLFISIPMMEKKILATRPAYADYQKRVSVLLPFFRRGEEQDEETLPQKID
ncbi:MAG: DUF1295 domain-containing protein, partial [Bacillota bacterium]|nr:DUF1295 domain-containing protein [Bacillota bacterium]